MSDGRVERVAEAIREVWPDINNVTLRRAAEAAIAAADALGSTEVVSGWKPIKTAPQDGTLFLGWVAPNIELVMWARDGWFIANGFRTGTHATHWMPLPASPAED